MDRDIIEPDIPGTGSLDRGQLRAAAAKSNDALYELARDIQWIELFVAADKTFCVDFANNEDVIRKRAEISGLRRPRSCRSARSFDPTMSAG